MLENEVLRTFGPRREAVSNSRLRKLHTEELCILYFLPHMKYPKTCFMDIVKYLTAIIFSCVHFLFATVVNSEHSGQQFEQFL